MLIHFEEELLYFDATKALPRGDISCFQHCREPLCNNEISSGISSGKQGSRSFDAHSNGAVFAAELYCTLGKNNFTTYSSSPKSFSNLVSGQGQFIGFALTAVAIAPNDQSNASLKTEMQ
ncbi:hypothetical protein V6N11_035944 [Hibiscus sabdariffa]|uniref:Uncharacterized protein n=1 Tax=Hibiscus sabdariffa TaxID=183260 RepID=A0ABR2R8Y8_9ROSI